MTEPDRIWINDKWEAYLRPTFDGDASGYVRADLADPAAIREAALREAAAEMQRWFNDGHDNRDPAKIILALIQKGAADDRA